MKITENTKLTFGRYKGWEIKNVPPEYLIWIFENNCVPAKVAFYINRNLERLKKAAQKK